MHVSKQIDFDDLNNNLLQQVKREIDPGLEFGFEIKNLIGEGAIGSVYSVENDTCDNIFAAKIIPVALDQQLRKKIDHEFKIQNQLQHKNICRVYALRYTVSLAAIFMELCSEGDLFDLIPIGIGLNTSKGFKIYKSLLDAIEYIHQRHIVHLDIKPENVMISQNGTPKLIDFGHAVDHKITPFLKGHIGTAAYSAPETFLDKEYQGYKADLFSLSVTFLTMVTGERCWTEATTNDIHYMDWHQKKWTCQMPRRLPTDLLTFLVGALAYDPNNRLSINQIKDSIWYRNGLAGNIKAIKTHIVNDSPDELPNSQPMNYDTMQYFQLTCDTNYDLPLSQPIGSPQLLMPQCLNSETKVHVIKRMTRFFSTKNFRDTSIIVNNIIEQHQHCTIKIRSLNHLTIRSNLLGFNVNFRMFVIKFGDSILVDFRRVRGDGLLFRNIFTDIFNTAKQLGLVNDYHPYLEWVHPK